MAIEVPPDLQALSDDELSALAQQIQDEAAATNVDGTPSEEQTADLERLADAYQRVQAEIGSREEAALVRAERVAKAIELIGARTDDSADETGEPVEEILPEAEPVAAATADTATFADDTEPEPLKDPAKRRVPQDPEIQTDTEEAAVADTPEPSVPAPVTDPVGALSSVRPRTLAPSTVPLQRPGTRREAAKFRDHGSVFEVNKGKEIDRIGLSRLIREKARQFARMGPREIPPVYLAQALTDFAESEMLTPDSHERNFAILEDVAKRGQALVASGANCAPLTPNYDVFNVAEAISPVEDALPTVGAPRGGIRYVQPPVWTQSQAGVRFTTAAQEAAGYTSQSPAGTTAPKPCVHLECRNVLDCSVDAISQCATIGNLQFQTFDELVSVFLDDLAVAFAQAKEIYYLDAIESGSTAVTFGQTYSATRSLVYALALAAHGYRKRNHMPLTAPLDVLAPDSIVPLIRADMVNDLNLGMEFVTANAFTVANELYASFGLNVSWYYDFSTAYGSTGAMQGAQAAGALNDLPTMFRSYLYAPGTWVRLDGGTLDVGMYRDSTLNAVNDLQIFAEEWTQVCKRGSESVALDLTLCPDGTGPDTVTPLACAS